jgi:hypothetical protein
MTTPGAAKPGGWELAPALKGLLEEKSHCDNKYSPLRAVRVTR